MVTNIERTEPTTHLEGTRDDRLARRIADLQANDPQFRNATPIPEVVEAASQPGLRLTEVLQTLVDGYAARPALGQRARELVTDPTSGRTSTRLLPGFETISYRELWQRVGAIATALRNGSTAPVNPGDFVATIGFASPDYFTVDLACAYLGLVSVPLQHNAPVSQLRPIIAETEPKVIAVGAEYLDLAVESALHSPSLRRVLVFDYEHGADDQREGLERAQARLSDAGMAVTVEPLSGVIARGRSLPQERAYTGGSDDRLAMIMYTSGSTGAPKGAMYHGADRLRAVDVAVRLVGRCARVQRQLHAAQSPGRAATPGVVLPCRRHKLFRSRVRSFDVVRGLGARAANRTGAGAQGGRHALPAVPQRRRPTRRRRLGRRRRRGHRRGRTARRSPRRPSDRRIRRYRAAGRGNEGVHRRGPRRAHHRRLRHDGGGRVDQGRGGVTPAGHRLQAHRRPRTRLFPHRQALSAG